jgi:hypothetical protein
MSYVISAKSIETGCKLYWCMQHGWVTKKALTYLISTTGVNQWVREYATVRGAKLSMAQFDVMWDHLSDFNVEDMEKIMKKTFKPSRRYGKATRSVKAIIRYNIMDGKEVAYYKQGGRFFKIIDSKTIRPMAATMGHISAIANKWSSKYTLNVVENDEQLLFNGVSLNIVMEPFNISTRLV